MNCEEIWLIAIYVRMLNWCYRFWSRVLSRSQSENIPSVWFVIIFDLVENLDHGFVFHWQDRWLGQTSRRPCQDKNSDVVKIFDCQRKGKLRSRLERKVGNCVPETKKITWSPVRNICPQQRPCRKWTWLKFQIECPFNSTADCLHNLVDLSANKSIWKLVNLWTIS